MTGSIQSKLPERFLQRMKTQLNDEYNKFYESFVKEPPVSVRINPLKITDQFQNDLPVPWCPYGKYLSGRPNFTHDPLFHAGCYYVQEASSMIIWEVLENLKSQNLLVNDPVIMDLCAAPGGKTTLLSSYFPNSLLVANEVIKNRASALVENTVRWGNEHTIVTSTDASQFQKLPSFFDIILIDAPCSGEGMFRKDPKASSYWSQDHVQHCALRQNRIINDILPALKPGGIIIYTTCTYAEEENTGNCEKIIKENNLESIEIPFNEQLGIQKLKADIHSYQLFPHNVQGEGLFVSVIKKKINAEPSGNFSFPINHKNPFQKIQFPDTLLNDFVTIDGNLSFYKKRDTIYALPAKFENQFQLISDNCHVINAGIQVGEINKTIFKPAHALALSKVVTQNIPFIDLDRQQAVDYLKKMQLTKKCATNTSHSNWLLILYKQHPLGWAKCIHGKIKNYFPTNLRIIK